MPPIAPESAAGSEGTRWSGRGPAAPELDQQVIIDRHEQVERAGQLPDPSQQTRQRLRVGKDVDQRDRADSPALIAAQPGIDPGARWGGTKTIPRSWGTPSSTVLSSAASATVTPRSRA